MRTAAYKQRRREFCRDFLQFVQLYPATLDCLRFSDEALGSFTVSSQGRRV